MRNSGGMNNEHVSYLSAKLASSTGVLSKLRYYTNIPTLIKVYHSLVCSHLNYALITWGGRSFNHSRTDQGFTK